MKTKLIAIFLLLTSALAAHEFLSPPATSTNVEEHFPYLSLGVGPMPLPLPNFSAGYRYQSNYFGFDGSLQSTPLFFDDMNYLKASFLGHYYPKPNPHSQLYVGAGISHGILLHTYHSLTISPEIVIGQEYINSSDNRRFLQAQISYPTLCVYRDKTINFPLVLISYGFGF